MKEKIYTIEVMDAVKAGDECPCCYLERKLEQDTISFTLGSSYMEDDIRAETDKIGFCRKHTKMMYDYGNYLGNAWILKTRMVYLRKHFREDLEKTLNGDSQPKSKGGLLGLVKIGGSRSETFTTSKKEECYVCKKLDETYGRIMNTFVYLLKTEPEFLSLLENSKGFCLPHFRDVVTACTENMKKEEADRVKKVLMDMMERELARIQEDIDWFVEKYDYRNQGADWKNSKDAVPRTMQKITGGYPADPVFRQK